MMCFRVVYTKNVWQVAILFSLFCVVTGCKPSIFKTKPVEAPTDVGPVNAASQVPEVKDFVPNCQCGKRAGKVPRIAGGEDAERNEFPWQAALVYRNTRIPFCGGTLINDRYVLTAAHCVLNLSKILLAGIHDITPKNYSKFLVDNDFQILLNAYKLDTLTSKSSSRLYKSMVDEAWALSPEDEEHDFNEGTLRIDAAEKIFHPKFVDEYRKLGFDYDIALIRLRTRVDLTKRNAPIPVCLPPDSTLHSYENQVGITIGWGRTNFKDSFSGSPVLQKLVMPVYSLDECHKISGIYVTRRYICAGHKTKSKDIGKSDSGGPLMISNRGQYTQIGIVSWGAGEIDGNVASAFTRVSEFLPWINERIYERTKSVSWCAPDAPEGHPEFADSLLPTTTSVPPWTETTTTDSAVDETTTYVDITYF